MSITPQQLASIAGYVLALILAYVPVINSWYARLDGPRKAAVAAALTVVVAVVIYALACARIETGSGVVCTQQGAWELLTIVVSALTGTGVGYITGVRGFTAGPKT